MLASSKWDTIDSDNGEQELHGYGVLDFEDLKRVLIMGLKVTFGVTIY